jgi:hypothetical protein
VVICDDEFFRHQCIEGTQRYRAALIAAGHMADWPIDHESRSLHLLASLFFRPQRRKGKRDKVVLSDLAIYRKPWREWPLLTLPERELEPRTDPITATELANRRKDYLDHLDALSRLQALNRVEELIEDSWREYRDTE